MICYVIIQYEDALKTLNKRGGRMFYFLTWVPVFMILIHYGSAIVNVLNNIQKLLEDKKDEE